MNSNIKELFLKSALTVNGSFISTGDVVEWMRLQNEKVRVSIQKTTFSKIEKWKFINGVLAHETGRFFSIEGIRVKTNWGFVNEWTQPIINQPEIGYLGFITREFDGVLHFLMQAKIEPGNVNSVQLSPTLQATKSNYTRAHQGATPSYLEYFRQVKPSQVLLDQLQSEQGGRFLKKRNRNIIIKLDEAVPVLEGFLWLTLGQIKQLMGFNNIVNMDTRTVVSGIPYGDASESRILNYSSSESNPLQGKFLKSYLQDKGAVNSFSDIISFITRMKCEYELEVSKIPLNELGKWVITDEEISHEEGKYFRIIPVNVEISNREVFKWSQPMVEPAQQGICAFICKEINGVLHFVVQAKLECGNFDIIELAPTVQCLTGNYTNDESRKTLPFLDYVLSAGADKIFYDTLQSEEGGRFYREQNRNMILIAGDDLSNDLPDNYIWMSLNQLQNFIRFNNYINIQARSLMAAITFV